MGAGADHIKKILQTLNQMQQHDDQSIKPFDFKSFWVILRPMMEMETHASDTLVDIPVEPDIQPDLRPVIGNITQLMQVFINRISDTGAPDSFAADKIRRHLSALPFAA